MRSFKSKILISLIFSCLTHGSYASELREEKKVAQIEIIVDSSGNEESIDPAPILAKMKTKQGDPFSQLIFDSDLKALAEEYDRVEPSVKIKNGQVVIEVHVVPRPFIHRIEWVGNEQFKTSTLQTELNIEPNTLFKRTEFNKSFNKLKEFYFKKGFFESELSYSIQPIAGTNQIDVVIDIKEGKPGYIKQIILCGFSDEEEDAIREQMYLKKYNFLTSWLSGAGIYRDEILEQDRVTILNYLQNLGYADAHVQINTEEDSQTGKLIIEIKAEKGVLYRFGVISFEGNSLLSSEDLKKRILIPENGPYSPDQIRETAQAMKDLYGQKGYIDANIQFETVLRENEPVFDVIYSIDEGEKYKIGLIHIFGNFTTQSNVILRESLLVPGETFDARKLKATQERLEGIGYFKSVNVYAVRSSDETQAGDSYRDVYIEVDETTTGSISLFMGFSSVDDVFGGLDLTERNFRIAGIGSTLVGHPSSLKGAGEYFHVRGTVGKKQNNILISWMNPYVADTLWRLGVELSQTFSTLQENVNVKTYGGSIYTNYPLSNYWTAGMRQRLRHSDDYLMLEPYDDSPAALASVDYQKSLLDQKGLISAFSTNINYDSTDSAIKPRRGWRSYFETEVAGIGGDYQFFKASYLNTLYFPVSKRGTLKFRGEVKYMIPFGKTNRTNVPYSERFFLGGETTVRGYKPFSLGPVVYIDNYQGIPQPTNTPLGGLSSTLLSAEYNHVLFPMLDVFVFFDVGSVTFNSFAMNTFRPTTGIGLRLDIGNRTPIMVGWGIPLVEEDRHNKKWQKVFFSMGGQF